MMSDIINFDGRIFQSISNSTNGDVGSATLFFYHEKGDCVWGEYFGGEIVRGMLLAKKALNGSLDMRYQHINSRGDLVTGVSNSCVEILEDGRYRLAEAWQWTSGKSGAGQSVLEETSGDARFVL